MKIFVHHICLFCASALLFAGCSGKSNKHNPDNSRADTTSFPVYKKPSSGFNDTLRIAGRSAVFFDADSFQLKKIRLLLPVMNYENDVHDCFYQMRNARKELEKYWPGVRIIDALNIRYLLFEKPGATPSLVDLDQQNAMCGIYIFDPGKEPLFVDMTNIDTELHFYFQ